MKTEKDGLTPETTVEILRKHRTNVTVEQAKGIVDFLYSLSRFVVEQYLWGEGRKKKG